MRKDNRPSVMEILRELQKGGQYVYSKHYNRIGAKTVDKFNLFNEDNDDVITAINKLVVSEDKLNVSITSKIEGFVKLNPKQAARVGLDSTIRSRIFRNQTIIKDMELNMESIVVLVDENLYGRLEEMGTPLKVLNDKETFNNREYKRVEIELKGLDIVKDTKLEMTEVIEKAVERDLLIAKAKVIKYYIDYLNTLKPIQEVFLNGKYTPQQIEILKEHGIDRNGTYVGVSLDKEIDESNYYEANVLKIQVEGQSTIPSVNAVLKKVNQQKKLNKIETIMYDLIQELDGIKEKDLEVELEKTNEKLNEIKIDLMSNRMNMLLNKDNMVDIKISKGKRIYTSGGNSIVLKIGKEKVYV